MKNIRLQKVTMSRTTASDVIPVKNSRSGARCTSRNGSDVTGFIRSASVGSEAGRSGAAGSAASNEVVTFRLSHLEAAVSSPRIDALPAGGGFDVGPHPSETVAP